MLNDGDIWCCQPDYISALDYVQKIIQETSRYVIDYWSNEERDNVTFDLTV